jgi:methionyl aminopeptidase
MPMNVVTGGRGSRMIREISSAPLSWMMSIRVVNKVDVDAALAAAQQVVEIHRRLALFLRPGQTLAVIDQFVGKTLDDLGSKSCFLGYKVRGGPAFPSFACLSVNDCIVHGTAAGYHTAAMRIGDVLKIDIGVRYKGWIGDAAWTYVFGEMSPIVKRLTDAGKESLRRGCLELKPGNMWVDWAKAVQHHVEGECGFHLVRGLGGHGIGRELHGPPFVSNVVPTHPGEWVEAYQRCEPGTLVAVEPMISVSTGDIRQKGKEWPIFTADGSLSVHYEHDVLITEQGPRILTEGLEQTPDVIPA